MVMSKWPKNGPPLQSEKIFLVIYVACKLSLHIPGLSRNSHCWRWSNGFLLLWCPGRFRDLTVFILFFYPASRIFSRAQMHSIQPAAIFFFAPNQRLKNSALQPAKWRQKEGASQHSLEVGRLCHARLSDIPAYSCHFSGFWRLVLQ